MGSLALRLVAVAACMALAAAKGKSAARKEEELPDSLEGTADPAEYDPKKLVQGGMDIGPEMDTWTPCFHDVCEPFIPYRALKSACLTGCRCALNDGLDEKEECEEYCTGVIDLPKVIESGEKVTDADSRDQWLTVCQKGCFDGFRIRAVFERKIDRIEEGEPIGNSTEAV